jgi:hypothetical protein
MAVGPDGSIYVVFSGSAGIRVAKSTDNGMTFNPSVFVGNGNYEAEIETADNGFIYIAYRNNLNTYFSMSYDGGLTFTNPAPIAPMPRGKATRLADFGPNVYILSENNSIMSVNYNFGIGPFVPVMIDPSKQFADIKVNPNSGEIYAISEYPVLSIFSSFDFGMSFSQIPLSMACKVNLGSYSLYNGPEGDLLFGFGLTGQAYKINLNDGNVMPLTSGNNVGNPRGRTIATDMTGHLVDGFFEYGILKMQISSDLGMSWDPEIIVASGQSHNVIFNPNNRDLLVAYSSNGQVFCNVYKIEPTALPVIVNTLSVDKITCNAAMVSGIVVNNASGTRGIAYGLSENPTTSDSYVIGSGPDGEFRMELTGLCPGTAYFARAFAIDANGNEYYALENMMVMTLVPHFTLTLSPSELLLPNHKMNMINASITNEDGSSFTAILSFLASNEPDAGLDIEDRPFDIQFAEIGTPDMSFNLRAEYSIHGMGRIYTVVYIVYDDCGNAYKLHGTVTVPNLNLPKRGANDGNYTFNVYPNPANDYLKIDLNFGYASDAKIALTDLMGNAVYEFEFSNVSNLQKQIDIQNLPSGTYLMYINFGREQFVRRVVKI